MRSIRPDPSIEPTCSGRPWRWKLRTCRTLPHGRAFLSASARFLREQGTPATVVQVTGGSARRARPGLGLWAAGAFGVRALTQAAALELREHRIHVALLIVDAVIDRSGEGDDHSADPESLAGAVAYLASQSPRAMTHELQVTPALDNWTP